MSNYSALYYLNNGTRVKITFTFGCIIGYKKYDFDYNRLLFYPDPGMIEVPIFAFSKAGESYDYIENAITNIEILQPEYKDGWYKYNCPAWHRRTFPAAVRIYNNERYGIDGYKLDPIDGTVNHTYLGPLDDEDIKQIENANKDTDND